MEEFWTLISGSPWIYSIPYVLWLKLTPFPYWPKITNSFLKWALRSLNQVKMHARTKSILLCVSRHRNFFFNLILSSSKVHGVRTELPTKSRYLALMLGQFVEWKAVITSIYRPNASSLKNAMVRFSTFLRCGIHLWSKTITCLTIRCCLKICLTDPCNISNSKSIH